VAQIFVQLTVRRVELYKATVVVIVLLCGESMAHHHHDTENNRGEDNADEAEYTYKTGYSQFRLFTSWLGTC